MNDAAYSGPGEANTGAASSRQETPVVADQIQRKAELIDALRMFDPAGDLHIAAICPEGQRPPLFRAVRGDFIGAATWIHELNADGRNIYWQPNRVRPGLTSKASADDIAAVRFFQVDIDPPKDGSGFDAGSAVAALNALPAPPSFIIHSGGGVQAFWRLSEPLHV